MCSFNNIELQRSSMLLFVCLSSYSLWRIGLFTHTHTLVHFLLCVCACIRARSYITRRWLAAFGYDVQIRTVRDYIIVWRGAGFFFLFFFLQNFPHGRAELAAACEAAQRESSSSICLSTFFFNLAFFLQTLPGLTWTVQDAHVVVPDV